MKTLNEVRLLGFVVTDLIKLGKGKNTVTFRLKTVNKFKTAAGEYKEEEEFSNIVAFDSVADNVEQYIQKGDTVYIEGRLHTRAFLKNSIPTDITEIVVNSITFINVAKYKKEFEEKNTYKPEEVPFLMDFSDVKEVSDTASTAKE